MATVVHTHSIMWTVNQVGFSAITQEVVQDNVSSSRSIEGKAWSTCGCVCVCGGVVRITACVSAHNTDIHVYHCAVDYTLLALACNNYYRLMQIIIVCIIIPNPSPS